MKNTSTSSLTTRVAGVLTALVMTLTVNGGMLLVFNEAVQGDHADAMVVALNTVTPVAANIQ